MIRSVQIRASWQDQASARSMNGGSVKLRRIIPLALAAHAGRRKLSPRQRASVKRRLTGDGSGQPA